MGDHIKVGLLFVVCFIFLSSLVAQLLEGFVTFFGGIFILLAVALLIEENVYGFLSKRGSTIFFLFKGLFFSGLRSLDGLGNLYNSPNKDAELYSDIRSWYNFTINQVEVEQVLSKTNLDIFCFLGIFSDVDVLVFSKLLEGKIGRAHV